MMGQTAMAYGLDRFLDDCRDVIAKCREPADCVLRVAPLMERLIREDLSFLKPDHFKDDPKAYARNLVYACPDGTMSIFTMVWNPGQWTPIHDHGTWGVVGVLRNAIEERGFIRVDSCVKPDEGIDLRRGPIFVLTEGSVSTFVPNPDHIHRVGVPDFRPQCVTLHLYGRDMDAFNVYNVEKGTRSIMSVTHNTV